MLLEKENFYEWAYSDLLINSQRGHLAEYIVAVALGLTDQKRLEWDPYDLKYGDIKIEVKSAAYIQGWEQDKHSSIGFDIKPTRDWNFEENKREEHYKRQSDVYIFCHLKHKDRETINPADMKQWDFYVLATKTLDEIFKDQKRVSLSVLQSICTDKVCFENIKKEVDKISC